MSLIVDIAFYTLALGVLLATARLIRGPTIIDRAMALDLLSSLGVSLIVVHALREGETALGDASIALAAVGPLGVAALALMLERRSRKEEEACKE